MKGKQLLEFIQRRPFVPFEIHVSDGRVYPVDHPEFIAINRDHSVLVYFTPEDDRTLWTDVPNIVTLEVSNRSAA
jgi:hypothetical protein